jgi:hypothetical protein
MDVQKIVAELRGEIDRISHAIGLLEGTPAKKRVGRPPASTAANGRPRRGITPAGRRKLAEAMKQRWAQTRGATSPSAASIKMAAKPKKRGGITAAGRKKLSEAMKRRWAEKKRKTS